MPAATQSFLKKLGRRIRHVRLARGWTQEDLAYAAKIERAYISDLEQGRHDLGVMYRPRLGKALKVTLSTLFEGE